MAWVRVVAWTSKLSHADCLKHFKKEIGVGLSAGPVSSMMLVQTGPNSGLFILQFASKRDLNGHDKALSHFRDGTADLQMVMTVHDGPVTWSR